MEEQNIKSYNLIVGKNRKFTISFHLKNEYNTYKISDKSLFGFVSSELTRLVPTTYCTVLLNDVEVATGVSKLYYTDQLNPQFGRRIALSKALKGNKNLTKEDKEFIFNFFKSEIGLGSKKVPFKEIPNASLRLLNLGEEYKIVKLKDITFGGNHPNNIKEGFGRSGSMISQIIVGQSFFIQGLTTSTVTEIVSATNEEILFKTLNSNYKVSINKIN